VTWHEVNVYCLIQNVGLFCYQQLTDRLSCCLQTNLKLRRQILKNEDPTFLILL